MWDTAGGVAARTSPVRKRAPASALPASRRTTSIPSPNGFKVYEEKTKPLVEFYRGQGLLRAIKAEGASSRSPKRLDAALGISKRAAVARRHRPPSGALSAPRARNRGNAQAFALERRASQIRCSRLLQASSWTSLRARQGAAAAL